MTEPTKAAIKAVTKATSQLTGDKQFQMKDSIVCCMPLDVINTQAELKDINNTVNKAYLSGKAQGSMLWCDDIKSIVVSLDHLANSAWIAVKDGSIKAPTGTVTPIVTTIGDKPRRIKHVAISALPVPVYSHTAIGLQSGSLNISNISDKQRGAMVIDLAGHVFLATGSNSTATWKNITDISSDITPIGGDVVHTSSKTGAKAISRLTSMSAMPIPVVPSAALNSASHSINLAGLSGKRKGAMVITDNGTMLNIAVALGSLPTDKWVVMTNGSEVTPA